MPLFGGDEVSGGPLFIATLIALVWVNSPWRDSYHAVWGTRLGLVGGTVVLQKTIADWAQDLLLPGFFFLIGIEVKQEVVRGMLSDLKSATLPVLCAIGAMLMPALLYLALNLGQDLRGWGATVTTDTAFALGLVALFGTRLPRAVRVLLLAFAAVDDIGGLLVIALVYTAHVHWLMLALASIFYCAIIGLLRFGIVPSMPYVLLGLAVCACVEHSGVHATIAGVMLGALVPVSPRLRRRHFAAMVQDQVDGFQQAHRKVTAQDPELRQEASEEREHALGRLSETTYATYEAGQRIKQMATPWVSYLVLPLFALSNAGVELTGEVVRGALSHPVALGIVAGLTLGKPIGMLSFALVGVKLGLARLPEGLSWRHMSAIGVTSGVGFTISLFIAELAFHGSDLSQEAKLGVLVASALSGLLGALTFWWATRGAVDKGPPREGTLAKNRPPGDDAPAPRAPVS